MRPVIDRSKELRRKLAEGQTLDQALGELRGAGASIFDCVASVKTFRHCELAEAKRLVESSSAWADYRDVTAEFLKALSKTDENKA
jgi:hypothetical protein